MIRLLIGSLILATFTLPVKATAADIDPDEILEQIAPPPLRDAIPIPEIIPLPEIIPVPAPVPDEAPLQEPPPEPEQEPVPPSEQPES